VESLFRDRRLCRRGGLLSRQYLRLLSSSDSSGYGLPSLLTELRYRALPPPLIPLELARRRGSLWLAVSGEARGLWLASSWAGDDCLDEDAEELWLEVLRRLGDGVSASTSMALTDRSDRGERMAALTHAAQKSRASFQRPSRPRQLAGSVCGAANSRLYSLKDSPMEPNLPQTLAMTYCGQLPRLSQYLFQLTNYDVYYVYYVCIFFPVEDGGLIACCLLCRKFPPSTR
jgi:hypothetical protein